MVQREKSMQNIIIYILMNENEKQDKIYIFY